MDPVFLAILGTILGGTLLKIIEYRLNYRKDKQAFDALVAKQSLTDPIRPRDARESRETIRKHDPALAMLLDVIVPVEVCDHAGWRKSEKMRSSADGMWGQPTSVCGGCGVEGKRTGPRNRWVTLEEYERTRLTYDKLQLQGAKKQSPDLMDIHVAERTEPVATMTTVYDPMKDIYQLYTTCKNSEGKTEYYAQTMSRQLMEDRCQRHF